jgi:hypothetical protein
MSVKKFNEFIRESAGGLYAMSGADVIFKRYQKTFDDIYYEGNSIKDVIAQFVADNMPGHQFNPDEISCVTYLCENYKVHFIRMCTIGDFDNQGNFREPVDGNGYDCDYWFTIKKQNRPLTEEDIKSEGIEMQ